MLKTDREMSEELGISEKAVRGRRRRMGLVKGPNMIESEPQEIKLDDRSSNALEKLLEDNNITLSDVSSVRISSYQQGQKNLDGDSEVVNLSSAAVTLKVDNVAEKTTPDWPVVTQAAPIKISVPQVSRGSSSEVKRAFIFPDPQIGFRKDIRTGELDPFHDERAMAIALNICKDVKPDIVVNLGDFIDLPNVSRYEQEPSFYATTQPSIDRAYRFLVEQRMVAPDAEIVLIEGNHDLRLQKYIAKNAVAAFGLSRAEAPDEWPVLSIPYLLRLDEIGVDYIDGYPNGEYYINDNIRCEHGWKYGQRGKIASKIAEGETVSIITGHTHHMEMISRSFSDRGTVRNVVGATLGCLCRVDGAVPSAKTGTDSSGRVVGKQMDWQQGVGVVEYTEGDGFANVVPIAIDNGTAIYNGKKYSA